MTCHLYRREQASIAIKSIKPKAIFMLKCLPVVDVTDHAIKAKIGFWNTLDVL